MPASTSPGSTSVTATTRSTRTTSRTSARRLRTQGAPSRSSSDLQGPKIRLGKFADGPHELAVGDIFKITDRRHRRHEGDRLDDVQGPAPRRQAGRLPADRRRQGPRRGRSRPTAPSSRPRSSSAARCPTTRASTCPASRSTCPRSPRRTRPTSAGRLKIGADLIALSFVRSAKDVQRVHVIMAEEGRHIPVIAKIEKPQAVDNLEEIIDAFDGIMVARGDLGVELPLEAVPIVQKRAVELCRRMAKPVIVATQMLESMIDNPVPTRAETSDVANAVLDGADAVMLSGETSVGKYPVVVVETMARIVEVDRGARPRAHPAAHGQAAHPGRRDHPRRGRGRRLRRCEVPLHLHRVGRHRASHVAHPLEDPDARRSRPSRRSVAGWRSRGACSRPWSSTSRTPTRCSSRSMTTCSRTTSRRSATRSS